MYSAVVCCTLPVFILFTVHKAVIHIELNVSQGRNVDALIVYFGEDPAKCPFEQGI